MHSIGYLYKGMVGHEGTIGCMGTSGREGMIGFVGMISCEGTIGHEGVIEPEGMIRREGTISHEGTIGDDGIGDQTISLCQSPHSQTLNKCKKHLFSSSKRG